MTKHKAIILDETTYNILSKMAHDNGRSRAGQIRIMVDAFERMGIQSVTLLPRPPGAIAIPVVNIQEKED